MCLYSDTVRSKRAKEDIICYKVLLKNKRTGRLHSPYFRSYQWELNKEFVAEKANFVTGATINDGYFHTFKNVETAIDLAIHINANITTHVNLTAFVYQCKIPAGTSYFTGEDCDLHKGYASKKLIIEKNYEEE